MANHSSLLKFFKFIFPFLLTYKNFFRWAPWFLRVYAQTNLLVKKKTRVLKTFDSVVENLLLCKLAMQSHTQLIYGWSVSHNSQISFNNFIMIKPSMFA
jgi:hypothetical protein